MSIGWSVGAAASTPRTASATRFGELALRLPLPAPFEQPQQRGQVRRVAAPLGADVRRIPRTRRDHVFYGEHIDDFAAWVGRHCPLGRNACCGACRLALVGRHGFVGVDVPVHDAQSVGEQQAADQRQLAQVIVGHDGDAPVALLDMLGRELHRVAIVEACGQFSVKRDLGAAERRGVGGGQPREVARDL